MRFSYPKSFPDQVETDFLTLVLCDDAEFPARFDHWSRETVLDDVDYATMRLLPLVYLRMAALGVRGPSFGRLQGVYKSAWVQNQRLLDALERVAAKLEKMQVRMLVLKGVPLLAQAYKNAGARFLGDADILIDQRDMKMAIVAMLADGWTISTEIFPDIASFSERSLARITKEITFRDARGIEIDIHWRLLDPTGDDEDVPFARWWSESAPFTFRGKEYHSLSPEDMLLHVIAHGAPSNAHRTLRWVTDAVAITRSFAVDWDRFLRLVEESGLIMEACVALSFLLEHGFIAVPEKISRLVADRPCPDARRDAYYARSNGTYDAFGGMKILWRAYWRHEAEGTLPGKVWRFFGYVRRSRGLADGRALAAYVWSWCRSTVGR